MLGIILAIILFIVGIWLIVAPWGHLVANFILGAIPIVLLLGGVFSFIFGVISIKEKAAEKAEQKKAKEKQEKEKQEKAETKE